jgi:hypothetical protein
MRLGKIDGLRDNLLQNFDISQMDIVSGRFLGYTQRDLGKIPRYGRRKDIMDSRVHLGPGRSIVNPKKT